MFALNGEEEKKESERKEEFEGGFVLNLQSQTKPVRIGALRKRFCLVDRKKGSKERGFQNKENNVGNRDAKAERTYIRMQTYVG